MIGNSRVNSQDKGPAATLSASYLLLAGLVEFGLTGQFLLVYVYLGLSLITLGLYGKDKYAAVKGKWRTPELWLHLFALLGGWPGALLGRIWFRHKTKKQPFTAIFWLTVVVNISVFIGALLPAGQQVVADILAFSPMDKF